MEVTGWTEDELTLHLPNWMPGYYQMMDYYKGVKNFKVLSEQSVDDTQPATWILTNVQGKTITLSYDVHTDRKFVANSYVDNDRAYIVPVNSFLYIDGKPRVSIELTIEKSNDWSDIATGLQLIFENDKQAVFTSDDLDFFLDAPLLMGNLTKLSNFNIDDISHRFWGFNMGKFDENKLIGDLHAIVKEATELIGHIPYKEYTFIGIGPGRGGIEHLNSTTVSFEGSQLDSRNNYIQMVDFLSHEYFHHYNVKRIRPFELGPFDYQNGSKTTQLWISEGLTSYYASLMVKRAGVSTTDEFLKGISEVITQFENGPGKRYQSLIESSFETWHEGPFGKSGQDPNKSISYYVKGPIVGLLMDFGIRQATNNEKSLDDVMRVLYHKYYLGLDRGFTDAEFREVCTAISGVTLTELFQYVYTAKPLDYDTFLGYAGLQIIKSEVNGDEKPTTMYSVVPIENPTADQKAILNSWLGEN
ncbi:hypothetical protein Musp01_24780 [Muricauda sp. NBRC 101325]|nr:hypothetical protein Musp01_24780 [Muricauda sp. NBRC 101325]